MKPKMKLERTAEQRAEEEAIRSHHAANPIRQRPAGAINRQSFAAILSLMAKFKAVRENLGLTLAEVAERMGTDAPALSRLETGKMLNPTLATLHKWAQALGQKLDVDLSSAELRELFDNAKRFFLCNTNRQRVIELEEQMRSRRYAAAWEPFDYPSHMDKVERGDAIFMYGNGAGIIGIGRAKAQREILGPSTPGRIRTFDNAPEWRVPVDWLVWVEDEDACPWKRRTPTFLNVTGEKHSGLREAVRRHFLSDSSCRDTKTG